LKSFCFLVQDLAFLLSHHELGKSPDKGLSCASMAARYDGQTFVKPPEVLTRDRLLGTYEVKPTLARLKATLLGTGSSLLVSAVLLIGLINSQADADGMFGASQAASALPHHGLST
jgi:hypothetical protein